MAASEILSRAGHEVVAVAAGCHPGRGLPPSFVSAFDAPVAVLASPSFVFRADRGVDMLGTLLHGARHLGDWRRSLWELEGVIDAARPDLVINFFEPLVGILQRVRPLHAPVVSAAHQFALLGAEAGAPHGTPVAPFWLRAFIRMVGYGSTKLALSFTPPDAAAAPLERHGSVGSRATTREPDQPPEVARVRDVVLAPPLLRRRVLDLEPTPGDYVLVYVATHGYGELVRSWHARNPDVRLHCFYDRPGAPTVEEVGPNLTFHQLDAEKFLRLMAGCRAVVCTAGFESICEAAYLDKPVLMIPLEGHHEQELNARDGEAAGVAVSHPVFDLDALAKLPERVSHPWFRAWCRSAEARLLETVEGLVRGGGGRPHTVLDRGGPSGA